MNFDKYIYRTSGTMPSHPATRVNKCPSADVTTADPDTVHASFLRKDAIIPNGGGSRPDVFSYGIRMTVHKYRCMCMCVCLGLLQLACFTLPSSRLAFSAATERP